jgi:hypothetical protein
MTAKLIKKAAPKSAAKPASKKAPAVKAKAVVKVKVAARIPFTVGQSCRPVAGARLFAFTAAWFSLTGFDKGAAMSRADMVKIAGERAVQYHVNSGNFVAGTHGLTLTVKGKSALVDGRTVDPQLVEAFASVMKTGKPSDVAGVKPAHIVELKAA